MIVFQNNTITLVSLTRVDYELVEPYLKYSDFIFHTLGGIAEEVTNILKFIDLGIRGTVSVLSGTGQSKLRSFQRSFQGEVAVSYRPEIAMLGNPYLVSVGISPTMREQLAPVVDEVPGLLRTFESRIPKRFEKLQPRSAEAFKYLLHALVWPPAHGAWVWNDAVSMGGLPQAAISQANIAMINSPWEHVFPGLFTNIQDTGPMREQVVQVISAIAAGRKLPVERVMKVLFPGRKEQPKVQV